MLEFQSALGLDQPPLRAEVQPQLVVEPVADDVRPVALVAADQCDQSYD